MWVCAMCPQCGSSTQGFGNLLVWSSVTLLCSWNIVLESELTFHWFTSLDSAITIGNHLLQNFCIMLMSLLWFRWQWNNVELNGFHIDALFSWRTSYSYSWNHKIRVIYCMIVLLDNLDLAKKEAFVYNSGLQLRSTVEPLFNKHFRTNFFCL